MQPPQPPSPSFSPPGRHELRHQAAGHGASKRDAIVRAAYIKSQPRPAWARARPRMCGAQLPRCRWQARSSPGDTTPASGKPGTAGPLPAAGRLACRWERILLQRAVVRVLLAADLCRALLPVLRREVREAQARALAARARHAPVAVAGEAPARYAPWMRGRAEGVEGASYGETWLAPCAIGPLAGCPGGRS